MVLIDNLQRDIVGHPRILFGSRWRHRYLIGTGRNQAVGAAAQWLQKAAERNIVAEYTGDAVPVLIL
jgi:hypothetical protein